MNNQQPTNNKTDSIAIGPLRNAVARCIGCGCDDNHACVDGCYWVRVDRSIGFGVCSQCGPLSVEWDNGRRL